MNDSVIFKAILQQRDIVTEVQTLWDHMLQKGKFFGRKLYHELISDTPIVLWCNLVLHKRARPREVMILWMIYHGKLATRMRLHKFGMVANTQCMSCYQAENRSPFYCGA